MNSQNGGNKRENSHVIGSILGHNSKDGEAWDVGFLIVIFVTIQLLYIVIHALFSITNAESFFSVGYETSDSLNVGSFYIFYHLVTYRYYIQGEGVGRPEWSIWNDEHRATC